MRLELLCPACGVREFDFDEYEALVLLAPNLALAQFHCPRCGIHLSVTLKLTQAMQHKVQQKLSAESAVDDPVCDASRQDEVTPAPTTAPAPSSTSPSSTSPSSSTPASGTAPAPAPDPSALSYAASLVFEDCGPDLEIVRPLRTGSAELKAQLEYFKRQLDGIETVDDAIEEIDAGYYREKRDV